MYTFHPAFVILINSLFEFFKIEHKSKTLTDGKQYSTAILVTETKPVYSVIASFALQIWNYKFRKK